MFEKFTERARRAVYFAWYEAKTRRAWAIEPEHLLLGLLREDPEFFLLLSPDSEDLIGGIRIAVDGHLSPADRVRPAKDIPLSPFGKKVVWIAGESSSIMGCGYVGTEHLLLGILKQGLVKKRRWFWFAPPEESASRRILRERGFTSEAVAARIDGGSITRQTSEPVGDGAVVPPPQESD